MVKGMVTLSTNKWKSTFSKKKRKKEGNQNNDCQYLLKY